MREIVRIIGSESVPDNFLGAYGILKEKAYDDKYCIEFKARVNGKGSLEHTVSIKDFEIIGEEYDDELIKDINSLKASPIQDLGESM